MTHFAVCPRDEQQNLETAGLRSVGMTLHLTRVLNSKNKIKINIESPLININIAFLLILHIFIILSINVCYIFEYTQQCRGLYVTRMSQPVSLSNGSNIFSAIKLKIRNLKDALKKY